MTSISERIALLIKESGLNKNSFSKKIGLGNNVTIGRIINEKRDPSFEVLRRIIQTFGHKISTKWLLTGEGPMEVTDLNMAHEPAEPYSRLEKDDIRKIITTLEFLSESMKTEIKRLKEKID